jgi:hypothetical protein
MSLGDSKVNAVCPSQRKQDSTCSPGQASFLIELWLQIHHWQTQLFGPNYEARYCPHDPPTHQVLIQPKRTSWESSPYLVCYLKKNRDLGMRFKPNQDKGFECYCDADFSGNWNKHLALYHPSTAMSRSGWILFYAGCPVI